MWRSTLARRQTRSRSATHYRLSSTRPVIDIQDATFYKRYPSDGDQGNPGLFPGLTYTLPSGSSGHNAPLERQYWSVISPSSVARTTFLHILAGQHICLPPTARKYPYLSDIGNTPEQAVKYVGFDADRGNNVGGTSVRGAYLSARYESRREETDFTVHDYLTGHTELNALEREESATDKAALDDVVRYLNLGPLLSMPVANLSNGQTRRARIAKALMDHPEVLLLDGPFMGLDPKTLSTLSGVLKQLAERNQPRLVISLRPEDVVPEWINHLVVVDEKLMVLTKGSKDSVMSDSSSAFMHSHNTTMPGSEANSKLSRDGFPLQSLALKSGEALVEMSGVKVSYGTKTVLGGWHQEVNGKDTSGLWWSLRRGQRAGIFGPNGSGKTTMLSLITSDHPQTYSLPVKLFGRSRLPEPGQPGISVFDLQKRMGHSSPEVHAFFPRQVTVRRALESAFADAPMAKPILNDEAKRRVSACLRWFARELRPSQSETLYERLSSASTQDARVLLADALSNGEDIAWATDMRFGELTFSGQRLALFLRAVVASPDLVILDEAFSGIDEAVRDKALLFLSQGEKVSKVEGSTAEESIISKLDTTLLEGLTADQALLVISHAKEDVPGCVREWICLPEPGEGKAPRTGSLQGPLELSPVRWNEIWGKNV